MTERILRAQLVRCVFRCGNLVTRGRKNVKGGVLPIRHVGSCKTHFSHAKGAHHNLLTLETDATELNSQRSMSPQNALLIHAD